MIQRQGNGNKKNRASLDWKSASKRIANGASGKNSSQPCRRSAFKRHLEESGAF
jgi:hypothetical protein